MSTQKVWFVTGASKGLGLSLVKQLIDKGYRVAATSRNADDLRRAVPADSAQLLPLQVDLKTEASVREAIQATVQHFGRIDVVVNNAGYGMAGSIEELTDQEARENFDINVFGTLNVIRSVMPQLRSQQAGHIINIASIGGFFGSFPGFGIYCATKFAVEGLSESLAAEVKPFGVNVTVVEPGYFRTEFLTTGSLAVPANPINAYESVRATQQAHQFEINGNQPGDPEKAVAALIQLAAEPNPPLHLFLGQDAYDLAYVKIKAMQDDLETWKHVTVATGFDSEVAA
ncbi:short-chain dehydrogenase/reductase SDR [Fibrisoma limi BUZ 3]|uniref:Short-chain dehydrogenase/reductase SDR n=1 Tax=Fibrisoma limi BUZ 3 TaxID=1185876 RepID=I2GJD5_9BACT|nr:oxidoreductase [Fibrisoma limi]CCH54010.1 short-chain dehydrogenase/reductase SDR [Fibrisoma limi BUZ 3]